MNKLLIFLLCTAFLIIALSTHVEAETIGPWAAGIHYGAINNFLMFAEADTDTGSVLAVDYSYDFTDRYTAALEIGFIFDNNVIPTTSSPRSVETCSFLNIDHRFYWNKSDNFSPYWKVGTGIYSVTLFTKHDNVFTFSAATSIADISLGMGADFNAWNIPLNADLAFTSLGFSETIKSRSAYIFTVGYRQRF